MWRELVQTLFDDAEFVDPATPAEIERVDAWRHETDTREWFASDLKDYLRRSVPKQE